MKHLEKINPLIKKTGEKLKKIDFRKTFKKFSELKKPVKIAICTVLVISLIGGTFVAVKLKSAKKTNSENTAQTAIVMRGNVINSITGSGTVEPIEQRTIVPLVNGKIIEAPFEEGDEVKVDDVLYRFEMTAAENAIKSAENNVEKARTTLSNRQNSISKVEENIENLTVRATASGKVSGLSLNIGEEASGKICTITNYKEQTATVPFGAAQIDNIKVGDSATVSIDKYMITAKGKVVRKYTAPDTLSSGAVAYNVEIRLEEDYVVEENINVTATVHSENGDIESASYGKVVYAAPVTVNAEQRGKVSKINVKDGDWINKGEVIAVLSNTDLKDELKGARQNFTDALMNLSEAENNLEDRMEAAKDYIVTSPINGVVLTKDYTAGDTVGGQNATSMMVVADMSKMKFTISVDELDISKIAVGQSVSVTADALENQRLEGKITSLSKLGASSNGVTTYPVEVTIDEPGDLMPGMNVSAEIIAQEARGCLYLPVGAVEYFGGKYYVTVVGEVENMPQMPSFPKENETKKETAEKDDEQKAPSNEGKQPQMSQNGERPQTGESGEIPSFNGERPQMGQNGERPSFDGQRNGSFKEKENKASEEKDEQKKTEEDKKEEKATGEAENAENKEKSFTMPSENSERPKREEMKIKLSGKEERVEVEIGISNDEYYEIKSGVSLGQVVKTSTQTSSQRNSMTGTMMGGMPGGMMGGMPRGAMGGMGGRR